MMFRDIYDGDTVIFQRSGFEYVENGKVVVIEKVGEEEGFGAWSLKRLVIEQPRSSTRNEFGEEIDGDNPVVVLYSYNPQVRPWQLDPSGRYRWKERWSGPVRRGPFTRNQPAGNRWLV